MSKNIRKNNKEKALVKAIAVILILIVVVLLFIKLGMPIVKKNLKKAAAEKTMDVIIDNSDKIAAENPEVAKILDKLSDEDKEKVTQIIENHMDAESVKEVMGYVSEGDKESLIKYAAENLTPEEMLELANIYGKYAE